MAANQPPILQTLKSMTFDPLFESRYIHQFADMVRRGVSASAYSEGVVRIQKLLSQIPDPEKGREAANRLKQISNYGFIHAEDAEGSNTAISKSIDDLAEFVAAIK
jgi:hypothetical protein